MSSMFCGSKFNGDISKWNVSKVTEMNGMFADSKFKKDISNWNVKKVQDADGAFRNCKIPEEFLPQFKKKFNLFQW